MTRHRLSAFTSLPAGAEALPPKDSDYTRAIHLPFPERGDTDWCLLRRSSDVMEWTTAGYLLAAGWTPADRMGMEFAFEPPEPGLHPLNVRVSVDFTDGQGLYAWSVATSLDDLVPVGDVLDELVAHGDGSALRFVGRVHLDSPEVDESVARHPAGKGLHPEDDS